MAKPAAEGKRTGAVPKPGQRKIKTESDRRQGRKAGRPSDQAALDAWMELTALVLACGYAETADDDPRASIAAKSARHAAIGARVEFRAAQPFAT